MFLRKKTLNCSIPEKCPGWQAGKKVSQCVKCANPVALKGEVMRSEIKCASRGLRKFRNIWSPN